MSGWPSLVGDAIDEPEVQAALAALLADEAQEAVDLEDRLASLLPSQLTRFAGPIAAGANAAVERSLGAGAGQPADAAGRSPRSSNGRTPGRCACCEGDGIADGMNVADGQVTLNLLPLVAEGLTALQSIGLLE